MKKIAISIIILVVVFYSFLNCKEGPFVFHTADSLKIVYQTDDSLHLYETTYTRVSKVKVYLDGTDKPLDIPLRKEYPTETSQYKMPDKLFAVSDIEGNFQAYKDLLINNGVMDKNYNWIFGKGHLVIVGDLVDRGPQVWECLWLTYYLEAEALKKGGQVHFLLGNHEQMNLAGITDYVPPKYKGIAKDLKLRYQDLLGKETELGRWMRSKNTVEQIGSYLFVHGGISPELVKLKLAFSDINSIMRENLGKGRKEVTDSLAKVLIGSYGPQWYRGLAVEYKDNPRLTLEQVSKITEELKIKTIVVGHTIVEDMQTHYEGKLITIDVHHAEDTPEGLMILQGKTYRRDDRGKTLDMELKK